MHLGPNNYLSHSVFASLVCGVSQHHLMLLNVPFFPRLSPLGSTFIRPHSCFSHTTVKLPSRWRVDHRPSGWVSPLCSACLSCPCAKRTLNKAVGVWGAHLLILLPGLSASDRTLWVSLQGRASCHSLKTMSTLFRSCFKKNLKNSPFGVL